MKGSKGKPSRVRDINFGTRGKPLLSASSNRVERPTRPPPKTPRSK